MSLLTMESKSAAHAKLTALIASGQSKASSVIQHVIENQPTDHIAKGKTMTFVNDEETGKLMVSYPNASGSTQNMSVHRNALTQLASNTDLPVRFIDSLSSAGKWGSDLVTHNLNTILQEGQGKKRFLLRSLKGEVRGVLSDRYRRIDSRPVVEAFATAVGGKGAVPYNGVVTDTKFVLQAIMPKIYEPVPGEMMAYGLSIENSDFGNGALSVRAYLLRIWCANLAITAETMRQVHLGARLDDSLTYSNRTYQLDAKATVSALKDVIEQQMDHKQLDARMEQIKKANESEVSTEQVHDRLKRLLQKNEVEEVEKAFLSPDEYNMPAGNTVWRLSNAISWVAGQTNDTERKLDLQKLAGSVLPNAA